MKPKARGPENGWDRGGREWLGGIPLPQVEKGAAGPSPPHWLAKPPRSSSGPYTTGPPLIRVRDGAGAAPGN
ncbi:hypothetical protein GCM10010277_35620 [Streptomyces longisporoflavus]|nr:hypothetical protein GCM10010277_35620 [Streptomyces longisporoflavus]